MPAEEWEWNGGAFDCSREARNPDFYVKFPDFLVWEINSNLKKNTM